MSYTETIATDQQEQADIALILQSTAGIADRVKVLAQFRGDTVSDLDVALAGLPGEGLPGGAAVCVLEPEEPDGSESEAAIVTERRHTIKVIEVRAINKLADGTLLCGVNRYNLRDLVKVALHGQFLGDAVLMWESSKPFADTKDGETIFGEGFILRFRIEAQLAQPRRSADPRIATDGERIAIIGGNNDGEEILYTTDGSTPCEANPSASGYSGAFEAASGTLIRASTTATGMPISGIVSFLVP